MDDHHLSHITKLTKKNPLHGPCFVMSAAQSTISAYNPMAQGSWVKNSMLAVLV
jgi:hypothetical protein